MTERNTERCMACFQSLLHWPVSPQPLTRLSAVLLTLHIQNTLGSLEWRMKRYSTLFSQRRVQPNMAGVCVDFRSHLTGVNFNRQFIILEGLSEHARWSVVAPLLLRNWLKKEHIQPHFWLAASQKNPDVVRISSLAMLRLLSPIVLLWLLKCPRTTVTTLRTS